MFSVVTSLWEEMTNEVMTGERLAAVCDKFTVHLRSTFTQGWGFCFDPPSLTTCDNFRKRKTISSDQTVLLQASLRVAEDLTHYCIITELKSFCMPSFYFQILNLTKHTTVILKNNWIRDMYYLSTVEENSAQPMNDTWHSADVSGGDLLSGKIWGEVMRAICSTFFAACKFTMHLRSTFTQGWEVCFNLTPPIKSDNFLNKETMSSGQNILTWYIITCCRRSNK